MNCVDIDVPTLTFVGVAMLLSMSVAVTTRLAGTVHTQTVLLREAQVLLRLELLLHADCCSRGGAKCSPAGIGDQPPLCCSC